MSAASSGRSDYDPFAAVYQRHIAGAFVTRALAALDRLGLSELPPRAWIVDLCCGTGELAAALSRRGYQLLGLDLSGPMLHLARRHAPQAAFVRCDARRFALARPMQAAISTFNSLAHVPTADLPRVFGNVRDVLCPGALFLFDLSMEEAYAAKWRGSFSLLAEGHACLVRPSFDAAARLAHNQITLLMQSDSGGWEQRQFDLLQHCHAESAVCEALAAAGFKSVESFDAARDLGIGDEWGRRFFRART